MNLYLFRLARVLWPYRSDGEILDTLRAVTLGCGRVVTEKEIQRAMENSKAAAWTPGQKAPKRATPPWPPLNAEQREAVIAGMGMGLVDLWEMSPVRFEDNDSHCEEIIDTLFPGNPLFAAGRAALTLPRATVARAGSSGSPAHRPEPMTSRVGRTQDGKVSSTHLKTLDRAASL